MARSFKEVIKNMEREDMADVYFCAKDTKMNKTIMTSALLDNRIVIKERVELCACVFIVG